MADEFKLGKAIWHNKDYDMPIDIVGKEVIDGRIYAKIKGSSTGIPLDEVIYEGFESTTKKATIGAQSVQEATTNKQLANNTTVSGATNNPGARKTKKKTAREAIQNLADTDTVRQMKKWKFTRVAAIGTAAVVGTGTILHMANNRSNKKRAEEQVEEQERNQRRRERRARRYMYAGTGYEPETFNGFVQDMFNQRSGHHKMGNSKFK